jgi:hypothetical protein
VVEEGDGAMAEDGVVEEGAVEEGVVRVDEAEGFERIMLQPLL